MIMLATLVRSAAAAAVLFSGQLSQLSQLPQLSQLGSVIRTQDIAPSPPEPAEEHGSLIPASYKHCISLMIMCGVLLHQ